MAITRVPLDYTFGTLATAAAVSDTTISATVFTGLGTAYSTTYVTPVVLHDPSVPAYEVVWITGHAAGSSQVTVARGKEGTSARAWPANTQVLCAPTAARDALGAVTSTAMPSDAHVGWRGLQTDVGVTVEQTSISGFQPSVGVAMPGDIGPDIASNYPPGNATMVLRAGRFTSQSDANGRWSINFRTPFPNACMDVLLTAIGTFWSPVTVYSTSVSGFVAQGYKDTNGTVQGSGVQLGAFYLAIGY